LNKGVLVDQGAVFPVTGRFMEFMFSDDADMPALLAKDEDVAREALAEATTIPADGNEVLDSRPATRWGSNQGIIVSAGVFNKASERKSLHVWGEEIAICINVKLSSDIDRQHLCISFSIKDLKGTDLIVSTTRDLKNLPLPNEDEFSVRFSFQNPLVTGKYLLVAAVENRQNNDIHYYEYIEGAHYFSSTAEARFFGLIQPQISQQILVEK
jgi:lipopolysaccharide transport system ATP-binding protein